jgi:hypothetical protein
MAIRLYVEADDATLADIAGLPLELAVVVRARVACYEREERAIPPDDGERGYALYVDLRADLRATRERAPAFAGLLADGFGHMCARTRAHAGVTSARGAMLRLLAAQRAHPQYARDHAYSCAVERAIVCAHAGSIRALSWG